MLFRSATVGADGGDSTISASVFLGGDTLATDASAVQPGRDGVVTIPGSCSTSICRDIVSSLDPFLTGDSPSAPEAGGGAEIGRASCRERV